MVFYSNGVVLFFFNLVNHDTQHFSDEEHDNPLVILLLSSKWPKSKVYVPARNQFELLMDNINFDQIINLKAKTDTFWTAGQILGFKNFWGENV